MASRITIYGRPNDPNTKRLTREMNVLTLEFLLTDPDKDPRAQQRLSELDDITKKLPVVEVLRSDDMGSVFLSNPDEPTLKQCLYSEGIVSVTSYWL
jgi:hypothetical protein